MDFKKKMNLRLKIAVGYILAGLALVCTDLVSASENYFYCSFGLALMLMGIVRIFRYRKITKNDRTMRKQELEEQDERIRMIAGQARSWAFSLSLTAAGIWVIVQNLTGHPVALW